MLFPEIHCKGQMTLPHRLRSAIGSEFANADDEYTPEQRRAIDARLAKSDEDIRHGLVFGPFKTADEMAASIEDNVKKLRAASGRAKPSR
jgi:hypothetical protein